MATTTAPADLIRVKLRVSLCGQNGVWEPKDEVDVPVADARRLVKLGYAQELPGHAIPKGNRAEEEAASLTYVETAEIIRNKNGTERKRVVRPRTTAPQDEE